MRVTNQHPHFSREEIAAAIRFTRPPGLRHFHVRVTDTHHGNDRGRAKPTRNEVLVRVASGSAYPRRGSRKAVPRGDRGYLTWPWMASPFEALVFLMAHELRHVWQAQVPRGRRVWGARGRFSERDADAYAWRKLRAWRRAGGVTP